MALSKKLQRFFAIAIICTGRLALADTVVQTNPNPEGTTVYDNLNIQHGCDMANGSVMPVVAESVIWPTLNPVVTTTPPQTISDWSKVFGITTLAGNPKLIQTSAVFKKQASKVDLSGNVIGFTSSKGNLQYALAADGVTAYGSVGQVPFRTAGISFMPQSCATSLTVILAVADYCSASVFNVWIPNFTSKFTANNVNNPGDVPPPEPPQLTYNRNLTTNPLPASCGAGYSVTIMPSNLDIDTNLPLPASVFQ